jgi:serine/threonine protein kinase
VRQLGVSHGAITPGTEITMTLVRLACPTCGVALKSAKAIPAGVPLTCPRCGNRFTAPTTEATGPPDPPRETERVEQPVRVKPPAADPRARWPNIPGYEILSELGHGGMGVVYKARQTSLNRLVALKTLLAGAQARADVVARFRTEATAIAQLQHPNIVQIHEVSEHEGLIYLSLEFVNGLTLDKLLAGTPQPCLAAAELVETLARAVAMAHQRGIVHRDLKPGNILLAPPGTSFDLVAADSHVLELYGMPKITDFGLAKRFDADSADVGQTRTGAIVGTPCYMAPEQALGRPAEIGPGVDVYALGVILYELLTGRPPFKGATALETLHMVTNDVPVPPRRLQPYVPRDLETICLKCLSKDPRQRYPNGLALAEDLRRYRNGEPIQARSAGPAERLWRWCLRYPVPASLLLSMVFCLIFGFWYLSYLSDRLIRAAALESAAEQSDVLLEVNNSYSDVVKRAQAGKLPVTHDYAGKPTAIPIPATFTIELGQQISERSETGVQIRLYSDYPFKSRRNGGPRDDFEHEALRRLRENPDEPVYHFEEYKGRPVLRYVTARRMQQTCIDCHNTHPDSPKIDWEVGDVRGVVEIIHPLDRDAARTRQGLQGAFIFLGAVCASLLGLSGLALFVGRLKKGHGVSKG